MHGLGARVLARLQNPVHDEIALGRRRRTDQHRFVGQDHVHGVPVGLRMDGNGGDAHLAGSTNDAAGNFAAVGNQYLLEHDFDSGNG